MVNEVNLALVILIIRKAGWVNLGLKKQISEFYYYEIKIYFFIAVFALLLEIQIRSNHEPKHVLLSNRRDEEPYLPTHRIKFCHNFFFKRKFQY